MFGILEEVASAVSEAITTTGRRLVAQLGFSGVAEVRRIADRFGRGF